MKRHVMSCEHCGAPIVDTVTKCPYCGEKSTFRALGMRDGLSASRDGTLTISRGAQVHVGKTEDGKSLVRDCPFCGGGEVDQDTAQCPYCGRRLIIETLTMDRLVIEGGRLTISGGGRVVIGGSGDRRRGLLKAIRRGHPERVAGLIGDGEDLEQKNAEGVRPLHLAVEKGDLESLRTLVAMGADVDAKTKAHHTALHLAAEAGQREMVQILLDAGAKRWSKTDRGKTARDLARAAGHEEIAGMLRA